MDFIGFDDIDNLQDWVAEARELKKSPLKDLELGRGKAIGLLFFNPSLRTRLSTQKAAQNPPHSDQSDGRFFPGRSGSHLWRSNRS